MILFGARETTRPASQTPALSLGSRFSTVLDTGKLTGGNAKSGRFLAKRHKARFAVFASSITFRDSFGMVGRDLLGSIACHACHPSAITPPGGGKVDIRFPSSLAIRTSDVLHWMSLRWEKSGGGQSVAPVALAMASSMTL